MRQQSEIALKPCLLLCSHAQTSKFNMSSNALRPLGWTSADAAGLPVYPGLFKLDEALAALAGSGVLNHALRFTGPNSRYVLHQWTPILSGVIETIALDTCTHTCAPIQIVVCRKQAPKPKACLQLR